MKANQITPKKTKICPSSGINNQLQLDNAFNFALYFWEKKLKHFGQLFATKLH